MKYTILYIISIVLVFTSCTKPTDQPKETPPNFLILMADDCTKRELGVYGGQAKTPFLNSIKNECAKFNQCFQATAMCAPTRQNLLTGIYPAKNGAIANHSFVRDTIQSIVHYLDSNQYDCWFTGKTHIGPHSSFPFKYDHVHRDANAEFMDSVIQVSKENNKAFCMFGMYFSPHSPFTEGDSSLYITDEVVLPDYWVDTKLTRETFKAYLAEITYFDQQVEQAFEVLEKNGVKDETIIILLSEQGSLFPFEKWTCYDHGLGSMLMVRYPKIIPEGFESEALVEYTDVVPTILDLAKAPIPDVLDGESFLPILSQEKTEHKEYVYGIHTTKGINLSEQPFGIRSIRSKKYKYILNLFPENEFQNAVLADPKIWNDKRKSFLSWMATWREKALSDSNAASIINRYKKRPQEELYDIQKDPNELNNLAFNEEFAKIKMELQLELQKWMKSQGDLGRETELTATYNKKH